jgi:hypothetical protein
VTATPAPIALVDLPETVATPSPGPTPGISTPLPADTLVLPPSPPLVFSADSDTDEPTGTDLLAENAASPLRAIAAPAPAQTGDPATTLAGGLVVQLPAATAPQSLKGLSAPDDDYSNWGNEGLW